MHGMKNEETRWKRNNMKNRKLVKLKAKKQ